MPAAHILPIFEFSCAFPFHFHYTHHGALLPLPSTPKLTSSPHLTHPTSSQRTGGAAGCALRCGLGPRWPYHPRPHPRDPALWAQRTVARPDARSAAPCRARDARPTVTLTYFLHSVPFTSPALYAYSCSAPVITSSYPPCTCTHPGLPLSRLALTCNVIWRYTSGEFRVEMKFLRPPCQHSKTKFTRQRGWGWWNPTLCALTLVAPYCSSTLLYPALLPSTIHHRAL